MNWDNDALEAIGRAPALLRGMVKKRVESAVRAAGRDVVKLADVESSRRKAMQQRDSGSGQQDEYGGLKPEDIEQIVKQTKNAVISDSRFFEVTVCGGAFGCPRALYDVEALGKKIVERIQASGLEEIVAGRVVGPVLRHHKFSVAISGCPNSCSQPQIHDFGLQGRVRVEITDTPCIECLACVRTCKEDSIAVDGGWPEIDRSLCINCGDCAAVCPTGTLVRDVVGYTVLIGGKLGRHPQLAREIFDFADEAQALSALDTAIDIFCNRMQEGERVADAVTRIGVEEIRKSS